MATLRPLLLSCLLGVLATAASAGLESPDTLECGYRKLMFAKVVAALAKGTPGSKLAVFESLQLGTMCGEVPPSPSRSTPTAAPLSDADRARSVFVAASGERVGFGEYTNVHAALAAVRMSGGAKNTIVLQAGVHFLNATMTLDAADSGTTIRAAPGAESWLSGGKPLGGALDWQKVKHPSGSSNVWAASLKGSGLTKGVPGLFTLKTHDRFVRARYTLALWGRGRGLIWGG